MRQVGQGPGGRLAKPAAFAECFQGGGLVGVDLEQLVEPRDLEHLERVVVSPPSLSLILSFLQRFCSWISLPSMADDMKSIAAKFSSSLRLPEASSCHLFELAADLVDRPLVEYRRLLERHDEHLAGVFQLDDSYR